MADDQSFQPDVQPHIAPASGTPVETFFELSRTPAGSPHSEHSSPSTSTVSMDEEFAGADYFTPGPATRPEIRRIMIEREKLPSYLVQKAVSPHQCIELFGLWVLSYLLNRF